jgi:hypothetical protein
MSSDRRQIEAATKDGMNFTNETAYGEEYLHFSYHFLQRDDHAT